MTPIEEQGYLITAFNTPQVNYVDCANQLAKSIRMWHPDAKICLLTDKKQSNDVNLFDYYREIEPNTENPFANDWQVFGQSPFRETIKLEADMWVSSPIDHWWALFRHRDVVISTGARDFYNQSATSRYYRKLFDNNNLPDVYNAITYWRFSKTAQEFFELVRNIFEHWDDYRRLLKFPDETASTDVVYAMAAQILGPEQVTMPFASYPRIVHMKKHMIPIQSSNWTNELTAELSDATLKINTVAQWGCVHYHVKDWRAND